MKVAAYLETSAKNDGIPVMPTFLDSIRKDGHEVLELSVRDYDSTVDAVVIWSVLWQRHERKVIWEWYRSRGIPVIVLEVGAIKRMKTWKVGINGVNRKAIWGNDRDLAQDRYKTMIELRPWKTTGDYILICTQHELSDQWKGMPSVNDWIKQTCSELRQHTDRPIVVRHHPRYTAVMNASELPKDCSFYKPKKLDGTYDDFDFDQSLINAWAVVNHSSNPAIDAAIKGVPVFCHKDNLAYSVGTDDYSLIETPLRPDRTDWANWLSHTEWYMEEIKMGIPWRRIRDYLTKSN